MEYFLGDMGLRIPLNFPAIIATQPLIKFPRIAADHFFLTVVSGAEAAGDHSSEVSARLK